MGYCKVFVLQLSLSFLVCLQSCICKPLGNDIQSKDLKDVYSRLSEDLSEEEESESRMENLLGNMKESFLRQLNLSEVPEEHDRISPSQFMVELYNKYASNRSAIPQSDVIRSFTAQDVTLLSANSIKINYRFQFNISIPAHEKINSAELQLVFFVDTMSEVIFQSFKAIVKIYKADGKFLFPAKLHFGREECGLHSIRAAFDVTTVIQRWKKSCQGATVFDVVVDKKSCCASNNKEEAASCLKVSMSVGDNTSAALIVYSDDFGSRRREAKKELRDMILHEEEMLLHSDADWNKGDQLPNEIPDAQHPRRTKRRVVREHCRRTSLKVKFKDIGWDSWIVAPPEYDAYECRGLCYHPLTDESTPSKHALIQTLMNIRDPKKANMACCVPIKLDPITVMYQENGQITIRYLYEEMKVAECGCR